MPDAPANAPPPAVAVSVRGLSKIHRLAGGPRGRLRALLGIGPPPSERRVLDGIDLDIMAGEAVALVGANGAGKSTLLSLLAGCSYPTGGDISVNGRVGALLELGAGFHPGWSGRDNAMFQLRMVHGITDGLDAALEQLCDFAGLAEDFDQPVRHYSTGMTMRLAFACATAISPDILLVDEALAVGDLAFQQKCYHWLGTFRAGGGTLILVTHQLELLPYLSQRVLVLDHGRIVYDGPPGPDVTAHVQRLVGTVTSANGVLGEGGDGGGRILAFSAGGTSGLGQSHSLPAGDGCIDCTLDIAFETAVTWPWLILTVRTTEGLLLTSITSDCGLTDIGPVSAGERRRVRFACATPLPPGTYQLDAALADGASGASLHRLAGAASIVITGTRSAYGVIDLSPVLSAETLTG